MSLFAPLAVPVEIRTGDRRVFRLSRAVGESGLRLERPVPFEEGQPVAASFTLAPREEDAAAVPVSLRALVSLTDEDGDGSDGGRALTFADPPRDAREAIARYVADRLGLPAAR